MTYNKETERLIKKWKDEATKLSETHQMLNQYYFKKHIFYNGLVLLIPFLLTFITQIENDEYTLKITSGVGFMVCGISNSLINLINFKAKSNEHGFSKYSYNNIINFIETNASREQEFKLHPDVIIAQISNEMKNLDLFSPSRENNCISDICLKFIS